MNRPVEQNSEEVTHQSERTPEPESYLYRDAGIREGDRKIPIWLALVAIGLLLWSLYYTVRYWSVD